MADKRARCGHKRTSESRHWSAQRQSWTVDCVARSSGLRSLNRIFLFVRGYHPVHHARREALDVGATHPHRTAVSRPDGRSGKGRKAAGEESPGSTDKRCRITSGGGNPRESATEIRPPVLRDRQG